MAKILDFSKEKQTGRRRKQDKHPGEGNPSTNRGEMLHTRISILIAFVREFLTCMRLTTSPERRKRNPRGTTTSTAAIAMIPQKTRARGREKTEEGVSSHPDEDHWPFLPNSLSCWGRGAEPLFFPSFLLGLIIPVTSLTIKCARAPSAPKSCTLWPSHLREMTQTTILT